MSLSRAFARVVRGILDRTRTPLRALARRSGIPERTLHRVVKGEQKVSLDQAADIAEGLEMRTSEIVAEAEGLAEGRT